MSYEVRLLRRAEEDFEAILAWLSSRSPAGAASLADRFEEALSQLAKNPYLAPLASEGLELREEVRHVAFRTKSGRSYRALFVVVGDDVRILRVRGPGQSPLTQGDLTDWE